MASYSDPYSSRGYHYDDGRDQNYQNDNSYPNPYETAYDPYNVYNSNPPKDVQRRFDSAHRDDDIEELESAPPVVPIKDSTPTRQRTLKSTSPYAKEPSLGISVQPAGKVYNGFDHGEFTPTARRKG